MHSRADNCNDGHWQQPIGRTHFSQNSKMSIYPSSHEADATINDPQIWEPIDSVKYGKTNNVISHHVSKPMLQVALSFTNRINLMDKQDLHSTNKLVSLISYWVKQINKSIVDTHLHVSHNKSHKKTLQFLRIFYYRVIYNTVFNNMTAIETHCLKHNGLFSSDRNWRGHVQFITFQLKQSHS